MPTAIRIHSIPTHEPPAPTQRSRFRGGVALLAEAAAKGAAAIAGPASPDAELIRLGRALDEAIHNEQRAFAIVGDGAPDEAYACPTALFKRTAEIVGQIEALPARTLAGLTVKRRALAWCMEDDPVTAEELASCASPTTDLRLIAGMMRDLAAMGSARA